MMVCKWVMGGINILLAIFTVYLFFSYFEIFFRRKKNRVYVLGGVGIIFLWQFGISNSGYTLSVVCNLVVTLGMTLFVVMIIFEGGLCKKIFFVFIFDAIWMLLETILGDFLMIYCRYLAFSQNFGSLISKLLFFIVIKALRKVLSNEEIRELPISRSIFLIFIPIGSIYIMNAMFILAYRTGWKRGEVYSLVSIIILLLINVLMFYVYIKLAEDLHVRKMNLVYEQQLELCERHQEETEISILQMRDVRHSMKSHFLSILAYAEKGDCKRIIDFVNDVIEEGNLKVSGIVNTGNIVVDSMVGYWQRTAEQEAIKFKAELNIPMEIPFKGADISLILGNLLENAVEAARKVRDEKYICLRMKYDKNNLLITVENRYQGELVKRGGELKTTKEDWLNHGIGLPSVRRIAEKYQGTVSIDSTVPGRFLIRVVLYGMERKEEIVT